MAKLWKKQLQDEKESEDDPDENTDKTEEGESWWMGNLF